MKTSDAVALLKTPLIDWTLPQTWCDLGCGSGTFTIALARLLPSGSTIHAIDWQLKLLEEIRDEPEGVVIRKVAADFTSPEFRFPPADGFLNANALHFVQEQRALLGRLLLVGSRILVVEYERSKQSRWEPYPVGFDKLRELFEGLRIKKIDKVASRPSLFGGTMYSALAKAPS